MKVENNQIIVDKYVEEQDITPLAKPYFLNYLEQHQHPILDRISFKDVEHLSEQLCNHKDEINYLLVNFNKILTQLKKTSTKLDKDLFISMVQREALENPVTRVAVSPSFPDSGNSEEKDSSTSIFLEVLF